MLGPESATFNVLKKVKPDWNKKNNLQLCFSIVTSKRTYDFEVDSKE